MEQAIDSMASARLTRPPHVPSSNGSPTQQKWLMPRPGCAAIWPRLSPEPLLLLTVGSAQSEQHASERALTV